MIMASLGVRLFFEMEDPTEAGLPDWCPGFGDHSESTGRAVFGVLSSPSASTSG